MNRKMNRYLFLNIALAASLVLLWTACSQDNDVPEDPGYISRAKFTVPPFVQEDNNEDVPDVRAILVDKGDSYIRSYWDKKNDIGVFPVNPVGNSQILFTLFSETVSTEKEVTFTGAGWGLQSNNSYAAYYPYQDMQGSTRFDEIPLNFTGQCQSGNNNLDHIGAHYDFMYAPESFPKDGALHFYFKHICGLYKLILRPPVADSWTSVTLTNIQGDKVFCDSALLKVSNGSLVHKHDTCSMTLNLDMVQTKTDHDTLVLYLSVAPIERATPMIIELRNGSGSSYFTYTKKDHSLGPGKFYYIDNYVEPSKRLSVDLGLPSGTLWSTCNMGAILPWEHGFYYSWGALHPVGRYYWFNYRFSFSPEWKTGQSMADLYRYTIDDHFYDGAWYDGTNFIGDGKRQLEVECSVPWIDDEKTDDAARRTWGGDWQIPSCADFQELIQYTTSEWVDDYKGSGASGYLLTSTINHNVIFFPAAGWKGMSSSRDDERMDDDEDKYGFYEQGPGHEYNNCGVYWTSDLSPDFSFDAMEFKFNSYRNANNNSVAYKPVLTNVKRYYGNSIRPVKKVK